MGRKRVEKNWRVEFYPEVPVLVAKENREAWVKRECEEFVRQVKRHVDCMGQCYVTCDVEYICDLCGREWEEDDVGRPMCCYGALKEWLESHEEGDDG